MVSRVSADCDEAKAGSNTRIRHNVCRMTGTGRERPAAEDSDPSHQPPAPSASHPPAWRAARWAGYGIAALTCTFALAYLLLVPAADWLAQHDIGNATGNALETARNNARGSILALTAGVAGLGALVFTARNFTLQRRTLELSRRTLERTQNRHSAPSSSPSRARSPTGTPGQSTNSAPIRPASVSAVSTPWSASPAIPNGTTRPSWKSSLRSCTST
jgi:hypothetical protein